MAEQPPAEQKQIIDFLKALDKRLKRKMSLYIIGGGALTLSYAPENRTSDIDVVGARADVLKLGGESSGLARQYGVYLSPVSEITFSVPGDWRERAQILDLGLKRIIVKIADPYDIVLGKLARLEPKDVEDIWSMAGQIDANMLLARLNENLAEVRDFAHYMQNALLLFSDILGKPIVFKEGKAWFE